MVDFCPNPGRQPRYIQNGQHKQEQAVFAQYQLLFDHARDMILLVRYRDGQILDANPAAVQVYGYSRAELLAANIADLRSNKTLNAIAEQMEQALNNGVLFETFHRKKSGETFPVEVSSTRADLNGEPILLSIIRDITKYKQAEKEIQHQLDRVQALRSIDVAIITSRDFEVTLKICIQQVIQQLHVDAVCILSLNEATQTFEYAAGDGFYTDALRHTHLHFGEGFAGIAAQEQQMVCVQDLKQWKDSLIRSRLLDDEGFVVYYGIPLIVKGRINGVMEVFYRSEFAPDSDWSNFLEIIAGQIAITIDNSTLFDHLQQSNTELALAYDATLEGWSRALDLRDRETEGHTQRVAAIAVRLGRLLHLDGNQILHMHRGALLHDIGKMGIPDSILLKPGELTSDEWKIMRSHPTLAYDLLKPIQYLGPTLDIPYCHHEKWDGSGYPRGLSGEQIPLSARIFAIVDVWDALCSDRPYRSAWPKEKAAEYIRAQAGIHFDPLVVEAFFKLVPELLIEA